jgi:hypothetical protein
MLGCRFLFLATFALLSTPPSHAQSCGPCLNSNYVAYNRCGYWTIDDANMSCGSATCQDLLFRLNSPTKKASYRFTLSPNLTGSQTINSVWVHYRTPATSPRFVLSVCADSNFRPGTVLASTVVVPSVVNSTGWQQVPLSVSGLSPGSVYHITLVPQGVPTGTKYIELSVDRGRVPVHYHPTDAAGTAPLSPCDRWLAIMTADTSAAMPDYFKEAAANVGYSPIFAIELAGTGLFGDPYDELIEKHVYGAIEYGQVLTFSSSTTVNYAGFWTRAFGDALSTCPNYCGSSCTLHDLEVQILPASNPTMPMVTATIPHGSTVFRSRPHWFGAFFPDTVLPAGTYYLVLRSPASSGTTPGDGWVFAATNSTLPLSETLVPTYQRGASYVVESTDSGTTFHTLNGLNGQPTKNADTAFMLGYFPDGATPLGMACDQGTSVPCGGGTPYAKFARTGDVVTTTVQCFNSGFNNGYFQYTRLLDLNCSPLTAPFTAPTAAENTHCNGGSHAFTMGSSDAFLWFESGHLDVTSGALVPDELFPIEVRSYPACGTPPCPCPP